MRVSARRRLSVFGVAVAIASAAAAADLPGEAATRFLRSAYPSCDLGRVTSFCRFVPEKIEPLANSELTRAMPDTYYFTTVLGTGEYEYPEVAIVLAVTSHEAEYTVEMCPSPFFRDVPESFLSQYRELKLLDLATREAFMRGLTALFASIMREGATGRIRCGAEACTSELLSSGSVWRTIEIAFDRGGLLSGLALKNPRERRP